MNQMTVSRMEWADAIEAQTGGRSVSEVVESEARLLAACKAAAALYAGTDAPIGQVLRDAISHAEGQ